MEFGKRLRNIRISKNLTQQQLADALSVTVVAIRNWERGARKPSMELLVSLGLFLNTSLDFLVGLPDLNSSTNFLSILSPTERSLLNDYQSLDSYGRKLVETVCSFEKQRVDSAIKTASEKIIKFDSIKSGKYIPHYLTPSAAGSNIPLDDLDFENILVDESAPAGADFAVNIQGNSMSPYILDGQMVYIKKTDELSIGDVGIFSVDGAMYCKQYYIDKDNRLVLASANPELKNTNIVLPYDSGSSVKCYGKVLLGHKIPLPKYLFE